MRSIAMMLLVACSGGSGDDSSTADGGVDATSDGAIGNDATSDSAIDSGPVLCNGVMCGDNETCFKNTTCVCAAGFVPNGSSCTAAPAGSPALHTQVDVCNHWTSGHVVTTPNPYTMGAMKCDPGTFAAGGITDTLVRLNAFRYLVGVGSSVTDDPTKDTGDQDCSIIAIWNAANATAHMPQPSAVCYNATGATWAGESNISWGTSSCDSIDEYVQDTGNETTLGHRRWILFPALGVVGIGWVKATGTMYGSAGCLGVFDSSSTGPKPAWYAWPPPGFFPSAVATWKEWSFHYAAGMTTATATVMDLGTNMPLTVTTLLLPSGYGDDTLEITPSGWTPQVGDIYRVTVTPDAKTPIVYDIEPVMCP